MGGIKSSEMNQLAKQIWSWCCDRDIWISANHIPGLSNVAHVESRQFNDNVEWMLDVKVFAQLVKIWGKPVIDLFATKQNAQVPRYISWKPDPDAETINAFSFSWSNEFCYLFPPFSLISRCVQKIHKDGAECLIIVPFCPTQIWYTQLLQLLVDFPRVLPHRLKLLSIPQTNKVHPLAHQLKLIACRLSGKTYKNKEFRRKLPISSWNLGDQIQESNIQLTSNCGLSSVVRFILL